MAGRAIFRESAVEAYRRGARRDSVPRLTAWPLVVFAWLSLGALVAIAVVAWSVRVPSYVGGSGVILGPEDRPGETNRGTAAALFLTPQQSAHVRVGQAVHAQVGSSGMYVQGAIIAIEPGLIGPDAARNRYALPGGEDVVTEPSRAVIVRLGEALSPEAYSGSRLAARVQIGSQRIFRILP